MLLLNSKVWPLVRASFQHLGVNSPHEAEQCDLPTVRTHSLVPPLKNGNHHANLTVPRRCARLTPVALCRSVASNWSHPVVKNLSSGDFCCLSGAGCAALELFSVLGPGAGELLQLLLAAEQALPPLTPVCVHGGVSPWCAIQRTVNTRPCRGRIIKGQGIDQFCGKCNLRRLLLWYCMSAASGDGSDNQTRQASFFQLERFPHCRRPPAASLVAAILDTDELHLQWRSWSWSPSKCGEILPGRRLWCAFPVPPHYSFGFTRCVQQSFPRANPTHHQVAISEQQYPGYIAAALRIWLQSRSSTFCQSRHRTQKLKNKTPLGFR